LLEPLADDVLCSPLSMTPLPINRARFSRWKTFPDLENRLVRQRRHRKRAARNASASGSKQSGMFWSESGATCVLNFRTLLLSQRFDAFWKHRHNVHAARNDCLPLAA